MFYSVCNMYNKVSLVNHLSQSFQSDIRITNHVVMISNLLEVLYCVTVYKETLSCSKCVTKESARSGPDHVVSTSPHLGK